MYPSGFVPGTALDTVSVSIHFDIVSGAQDILGGGKSLIPLIPPQFFFQVLYGRIMVPPSSVSPIDAEKLWWELCSHHNQPSELCSFGSSMGFHVL